jgi:hypothetical protein
LDGDGVERKALLLQETAAVMERSAGWLRKTTAVGGGDTTLGRLGEATSVGRVDAYMVRLGVAAALKMVALISLKTLSVGWEVSTRAKLSPASDMEKPAWVRLCPLAELTAAKLTAAKLTCGEKPPAAVAQNRQSHPKEAAAGTRPVAHMIGIFPSSPTPQSAGLYCHTNISLIS